MYVIKLGGSAITVKNEPFKMREEVIDRIPMEIEPALPNLILVHGAGSFGHQLAAKYAIHEGYKEASQLTIAALLKYKMNELTSRIQSALIKANVPVFPFHPSSFMILDDGSPKERNLEPLKGFIRVGLVPLIPPDGAFDVKRGFGIVSGDVSAAIVAKEMGAKALIYGVNVDGVLKDGELVEELTPEEALKIAEDIEASDVTGGMAGKLRIAAEVASEGIPVYIINLLVPGRLHALLSGKEVPCTVIKG